jgi:hypothetical protein
LRKQDKEYQHVCEYVGAKGVAPVRQRRYNERRQHCGHKERIYRFEVHVGYYGKRHSRIYRAELAAIFEQLLTRAHNVQKVPQKYYRYNRRKQHIRENGEIVSYVFYKGEFQNRCRNYHRGGGEIDAKRSRYRAPSGLFSRYCFVHLL